MTSCQQSKKQEVNNMTTLFKVSELILDAVSVVVTPDRTNRLALLELAEMQKKKVDGNDLYEPNGNRITASLDYDELDENIAILQDASNHLKRNEV